MATSEGCTAAAFARRLWTQNDCTAEQEEISTGKTASRARGDLPGVAMPVAWVMLNGAAGSGPLGQRLSAVQPSKCTAQKVIEGGTGDFGTDTQT